MRSSTLELIRMGLDGARKAVPSMEGVWIAEASDSADISIELASIGTNGGDVSVVKVTVLGEVRLGLIVVDETTRPLTELG